ncbi:hypothetical protein V8C86DRAFT_3031017 [Haematococcus lacustris]
MFGLWPAAAAAPPYPDPPSQQAPAPCPSSPPCSQPGPPPACTFTGLTQTLTSQPTDQPTAAPPPLMSSALAVDHGGKPGQGRLAVRGLLWLRQLQRRHARSLVLVANVFKLSQTAPHHSPSSRTVANPMVWSQLLALLVSCSGLRRWLDPGSPDYQLAMGWLTAALTLMANTAVPLSLFTNGVWLHGKQFWAGNMRKAAVLLALKLLVLPALQLACAWVVGLSTPLCGTLLLLAVCPPASTAFVISSHYGHGTEVRAWDGLLHHSGDAADGGADSAAGAHRPRGTGTARGPGAVQLQGGGARQRPGLRGGGGLVRQQWVRGSREEHSVLVGGQGP